MATDVAEVEALEAETSLAEEQVPSEEVQAQKEAEILAETEKILQPDTPKTEAGEGAEPPAEEKSEVPDESLDQAMLTRALGAGFDEDAAKRFHQAGLLEDALTTFDQRLIRNVGAARGGTEEPPPQQAEPDRSGKPDDLPGPLSAEEYGEEIVKRDGWHQQRIDELTAQVEGLQQVSDAFLGQRAQGFESWFEERVQALDNAELFGKGTLDSLAPNGSAKKNRFAVADAYNGLCWAYGLDPYESVPEFVERAYHAAFHSEITKAAQHKTLDRLRNAKGQFVTPTRPSGSGPPAKDERTEEERDADVMKEVQGILARPPK